MTDSKVSFRLGSDLRDKLDTFAAANGVSQAKVLRDALEGHLQKQQVPMSSYDLAKKLGILGCIEDGLPPDLSANTKKYMEGFGES